MEATNKGSERGGFGMSDGTVRLETHTPFDPLLGASLPYKRVVHSKGEHMDTQLGGNRDKLFAILGWKKGGKNRKRPDSGVKATPTPERVEVRCGMVHVTPKWVALVKQFGGQLTPSEMGSIEATIVASAGLHDTLREYLSRPAGPQVM